MIRGVHHIAIATANMERMLSFYRDGLGFAQIDKTFVAEGRLFSLVAGLDSARSKVAWLRANNIIVELFEFISPEFVGDGGLRDANRRGYTHLALDVVDIDEVYERALAAGATFHAPPQDFGELKSTYGRDPEGNIFEIQELVDPDHRLQLASLQNQA